MSGPPPQLAHLSAEQLFRQHGSFVARFLTHLGVAERDLDDVVQEVFLVAHARGGYNAGPAKPTSYLGSIAIRAAHSYRRRQQNERQRRSDAVLDDLAAHDHNPAEQLEADQRATQIRAALASLPEDLRVPLLLVELEGESCASVAASLACPVGTVYWRLHNARKQFARALAAQPEVGLPRAALHPTPKSQKGSRS